MTTNKENQPKGKIKNNSQNNNLDIISLHQLYDALIKASVTLEQIFSDLGINMERIKEAKKLIDTRTKFWELEKATEYLDIIIANAGMGNPQILTNNGWLVQVTALTEDIIRK